MRQLALALVVAALAVRAHATVFSVTSAADVPDDAVGDGTCHAELGLPGVCTLRAAIQEANAHPGADQINLDAGQVYTLTRGGSDETALSGDLDITDDVTILFFASGERPIVDAGGLERAFDIHGGNVTMLGFDVTGGDATLPGDQAGGGVAVDFDAGVVQLSLMRFYGNRANFGGGLYNDGPDTRCSACEFFDNEEADDFVDSAGAAVFNRGTLVVDHSSVHANHGVGGLGAFAIRSVPPVTGSTSLSLVDSTIAANLGIGVGNLDDATLVVRNATIASNSNVGIAVSGVGGTFQMRNSVVARNGGQDCTVSAGATLNLDRYNMDSDDTCELAQGSSNYPGVEPQLTPLAFHGGFTPTAWPLVTSPMVDAGHPVIGAIGCEEDDQMFADRPTDGDGDGNARCDVGAIELADDVLFHDPFERL